MADKTQINLERIRACDAEWEESKHPRSENGQFTSGSGAHVSKLQSGGKAKVQQLKNVASALAGVNAGAEQKKFQAAKATLEKGRSKIAATKEANNLMGGATAQTDFYSAKNRLLNSPDVSPAAKKIIKSMKATGNVKPTSMDGLVQHYIDKGDNERASIAIQLRMEMMDGHDLRGALHNLLSKYDEAEDKGWIDRDSYDKNVDMLLNDVSGDAWDVLNPAKPANAKNRASKK